MTPPDDTDGDKAETAGRINLPATFFRPLHAWLAGALVTAAAWTGLRKMASGALEQAVQFKPGEISFDLTLNFLFILLLTGGLAAFARFIYPRTMEPSFRQTPANQVKAAVSGARWAFILFGGTIIIASITAVLMQQVTNAEAPRQEIVTMLEQNGTNAWDKAAIYFFAIAGAPLSEELLFRFTIFRGLRTRLPFLESAIISSALFSILHLNLAALPSIFFLGIMFAWLYEKHGSLWTPAAAHAVFNTINCLILSVAGVEF